MSMTTWTNRRFTFLGLALLGLALALLAWWQLSQQRMEMRHDLLALIRQHRQSLKSQFHNLQNQFTPGFKAHHASGNGLVDRQGQIFKAQLHAHLAVNGVGYFGVRHPGGTTLYTRDGRFQFDQGILCNAERRAVLGYRVGSEQLCEVSLGRDYAGYHFDASGILYGEKYAIDPTTGQQATASTPLFQVALFGLDSPRLVQPPTLLNSSKVQAGKAGQGALGQICPGSLELSNVDFLQHGLHLQWTKTSRQWSFAGLPSSPLQDELCQRLTWDGQLRSRCLEELRGDLTPGYRSRKVLDLLIGGSPLSVSQEQGLLLPTHNSMDLALDGQGYFRHSDGTWSRTLDLAKDKPLGRGTPEGPEEVLRIPPDATNVEVRPNGEVRWLSVEGDGSQVVGFYLRLGQAEQVSSLGSRVRPVGATCLGVPGEKGLGVVAQGNLEMSNQDPYQRRILGAALMQWAGLPLLPEPPPDRGAAQTNAPPLKLYPETPNGLLFPGSGLLSK